MVKQIEYLNPKALPVILKILNGPYKEHLQRYLFATNFAAGKKVLDVACGVGYGTYELSRVATAVVGFDINVDALGIARTKYAAPNVEYVQGDAIKLPFEDGQFDCVVSFETLEHLPIEDMKLFLQELTRVLKRGGRLLLSSPNRNGLSLGYVSSNPYHTHEFLLDELKDFVSPYLQFIKSYGQEFTDQSSVRVFAKLFKFLPDELAQRIWRFIRVLLGCSGEVTEYSGDQKVPLYMIIECQKV